MEIKKVNNITENLDKYDYLAKPDDYISVTEWSNSEGIDIDVNGTQSFHLKNGEIEAIYYLYKTLNFNK